MKPFRPLLLICLSVCLAPALAQAEQLTPGLWQHHFQVKSESGQLEQALAQMEQMLESMPPDQRQMVKDMMSSQGIDLSMRSYTTDVCISEQEAKNNTLPEPNDDCEQTVLEETANGFKVSYKCSGNPPVSGVGEMRMSDSKNYTINTQVNTELNGQPEAMTIEQTGKWLAADCS